MFAKLLASLGLAPKTLPQATETLATAKTFAESVNALFTAAALNLETMLSAGPDSLKLHIAGLDNSAEVTRLTSELKDTLGKLKTAGEEMIAAGQQIEAHAEIFKAIGFAPAVGAKPADAKSAFEAHVQKQTTLALAKTGHPPAHVPASVETQTPAKSDAELYTEYKAMAAGPIRLDFFTKHEAALKRALNAK